MWNLVGMFSIVVGAALIYAVLMKKFPQLKLIDLSTLAKERHAEVKTRIMKDRFERATGALRGRAKGFGGAVGRKLAAFYDRLHGRLREMEKNYDRQLTAEEAANRVARLLTEAENLRGRGEYDGAETDYIEILRLEPKRIEAYRGLAEVYIGQKQFDQAKETLEFLVKMNENDDRAFERLGAVEAMQGNLQGAEESLLKSISLAGNVPGYMAELGRLYLGMGDPLKASQNFRSALEKEPYNPKYLDYFLEACILIGDVKSADEAFEVLETANPENQKLAEFRDRIDRLRQQNREMAA